ncbi:hypothetical protein AB833_05665 [Chromatiales bacterium (ex Bugula neritina AB1)]|nr:hypothetical protein AB833_05665 [Chromatiales bacterium (ex Bugula neritina AB1)]
MTNELSIALLQHVPAPDNIAAAVERLESNAATAAAQNCSLLVVPEASITGYNIPLETMQKVALPADGETTEKISAICRQHNIAIAYGFAERDGSNYFNCVQLIDKTGTPLGKYRKTHLWGDLDRTLFTAGDNLAPLINIEGWKVGLLICYDIEFPECARRLALEGADLILTPTGLMQPWREVAERVVPTRAYENQLYIAYANYCGSEAELNYEGRSCIVDPNGEDLARAAQETTLLTATLTRTAIDEARAALPYHRDRRPELYSALGQ